MKRKDKITLNDIEKKQIFSVPDNYFEQLPSRIQEKISEKQENPVFWSLPWARYSLSAASLVVVLLCGYLFYVSDKQPAPPATAWSDISNQEIVEYLRQNEISQYEVIETAVQADISLEEELPQQLEFNNDSLLETIDVQTIQDYI